MQMRACAFRSCPAASQGVPVASQVRHVPFGPHTWPLPARRGLQARAQPQPPSSPEQPANAPQQQGRKPPRSSQPGQRPGPARQPAGAPPSRPAAATGSTPNKGNASQPAGISTGADAASSGSSRGASGGSSSTSRGANQARGSRKPAGRGKLGAQQQRLRGSVRRQPRVGGMQHQLARDEDADAYAQGNTSYEDADYDDFETVVEQPGDEAIEDPEEVERLLFGGKDFTTPDADDGAATSAPTRGSAPSASATKSGAGAALQRQAQRQQAQLAACREALTHGPHATTIPPQLAEVVLRAAVAGLAPAEDPSALVAAVLRVLDVVSELPPHQLATRPPASHSEDSASAPGLAGQGPNAGASSIPAPAAVRVLWGLQEALAGAGSKVEGPGEAVGEDEVVAAALRVPSVLRLTSQDVRERMKALQPLLTIPPSKLPAACCRHPEVLVAPLEEVRKKLLLLRNTTGLTGEAALGLMTPHMFGSL